MDKKKLTSPRVVAQLLNEYDLSLKKAFGQHFLVDENIRRKIIEAADLSSNDVTIEIGPGIGTLSQEVAPKVKKLYLIELEKHFIPILEQNLTSNKNIEIIQQDALKLNWRKLEDAPNKMVSNLPYKIAAPLIIKYLSENQQLKVYILMIQEEMAKRLTAKPNTKDYGALTVKIDYLAKISTLFKVSEQVFMPKPKVKSAVIRIEKRAIKKDTELFTLIEGAFAYRRKSLKKALSTSGFNKVKLDSAFDLSGIDPNLRAENLSVSDFKALAKALYVR